MHHFTYKDGILHAENVSVPDIAAEVGTPFYCYSTATLTRHFEVFDAPFGDVDHLTCYAMKANSNQAIIKTLGELGAGMDIVSGGELKRALAAGIRADKIIFSGVGKTEVEISAAVQAGILCFNAESESELHLISQVASAAGKSANISLRINPDVDAKTHAKIATGKAENKFGVPWTRATETYALAASLPGLHVCGIDVHIGSQIVDLEPYAAAYERVGELVRILRGQGHDIQHVDLGGGLGIPYRHGDNEPPLPTEYANVIKKAVGSLGCKIITEPGRLIAGNAGILVARVVHLKRGEDKHFAVIDAAMNDLIRPTLYEAHHDILRVRQPLANEDTQVVDVVGPVCETGDYSATDRELPILKQNDLVAIMTAGAYGAVQSGTYNSRALIPEVLVNGDQFAIVRRRFEVEDIIALDQPPPWQ